MSYRTIARLDLSRHDVIRDLNDRDFMHKRLMSLYPNGLGNNARQAINLLFVANPDNGQILFQSDLQPVLGSSSAVRDGYFSRVITEPTQEINCFINGDTVSFQFWMAAQERSTATGKRVDLSSGQAAVHKAVRLLARAGLAVTDIDVVDWQPIKSARRKIGYKNAELTGTGTVINQAKLRKAISVGLGSGRLWGSGVLVISAD